MDGLKQSKYLHVTRKRFDPLSIIASVLIMIGVAYALSTGKSINSLIDPQGLIIVVGGTLASILFQFDIWNILSTCKLLVFSMRGIPEKKLMKDQSDLDKAVIGGYFMSDIRTGEKLNGDLLNDIVYMSHQGLLFDEIDTLITARVKDELYQRNTSVMLLEKAANIAPALGLFGTVIGLIGVLKGLSNPAAIGPSMSLALITTAYGAGLASLFFNPLAGRLEHHNEVYVEFHRQILSKTRVLLLREERSMDHQKIMENDAA